MKKLIIFAAALSAAAAFAQTPPAPTPTGARSDDPGEIVCRTLGDTSSRLKTRRVCMTRAEWRARNLEQGEASLSIVPQTNRLPLPQR